jgi:hypothetical protein
MNIMKSTMKITMKKLVNRMSAGAILTLLALASAVPTYADKTCSASINLKNCVSTLDSVSSSGTDLTLKGVLKVLNIGSRPGSIVSVVANLQTKDPGGQYETIATVRSCDPGFVLIGSMTVPGGPDLCGGANESDISYIVTFPGVVPSLVSGKQARLELQAVYDGGPNGSAIDPCGSTTTQCNGLRIVNVRFGFVVP